MGKPVIDLTGREFGRLTVISRAGKNARKAATWRCRCECGKEAVVASDVLRRGDSNSCGCLKLELIASRQRTHGHTCGTKQGGKRSPMYIRWRNLISRCENPNNTLYHRYGGRGIKVCERWRSSFETFLSDMGEPASPRLTLDRINNDGDYEPGNCRWATRGQQGRNTSNTRLITFNGETLCLTDWARRLSITPAALHARLRMRSLATALT